MFTALCMAGVAWALSLLVFLYLVHTAPLLDEDMRPVSQQQPEEEEWAA